MIEPIKILAALVFVWAALITFLVLTVKEML